MSIAGGFARSVERARAVGATALQIFVKSSSQWRARGFRPGEAAEFRGAVAESGLQRHVIAHASYLLNLASPEPALRERSMQGLAVELERCAVLAIPALVLHPGAHMGAGTAAGVRRVAGALARVLRQRERARGERGRPVRVLLELTAGQGTQLGSRFEEIAGILERSRRAEWLGVCLDTCHASAAGYDLTSAAGVRATLRELDRVIGLGRLGALHLNDSKTPRGSRRDRHEHIGQGTIGREGFRAIVRSRRLRGLPMVLETPKGPDLDEDRRNLATLRELAGR